MIINRKLGTSVALIVLLTCASVPVWADRGERDKDRQPGVTKQDRSDRSQRDRDRQPKAYKPDRSDRSQRDGDRQPRIYEKKKGYVFDKSYRHNQYYPPRGYRTPTLPRGHKIISYRGKRYYHYNGIWYFHSGARYIVVRPPIGLTVSFLPAFYTTIWVGGFPYYYANDVYYVWRPEQREYVVTNPPPQTEISEQPADPDRLFVYPKKGQNAQQQATDRYQCYQWSTDQTGFDPTRSGGNVPESDYSSKRADYHRAMKACLEARGYSVQ